MIRVNLPDKDLKLNFPDGTPDHVMISAINKNFYPEKLEYQATPPIEGAGPSEYQMQGGPDLPADAAPGFNFEPSKPAGMIEPGNIDLGNRPVVKNSDGSVSTEDSISIGTDRGEVLIPRVVNGKHLTSQQAIDHWKRTGENLGVFKTSDDANKYAEGLHQKRTKELGIEDHPPDTQEPDFMGEAVGEPGVLLKATQVPFIPGEEIANAPGPFTAEDPYAIDEKGASIADLTGAAAEKVLGAGAASEALPYQITEPEDFKKIANAAGRLAATMGIGVGVANIMEKALVGSIGAAVELILNSTAYRRLTIPERQLAVQSLDEMAEGLRAQGKTEGEIARAIKRTAGDEKFYQKFVKDTGRGGTVEGEAIKPRTAEPTAAPAKKSKVGYEERPIVLTGKDPGRGAIVHPSTKYPGKWQTTTWDKRGFVGDEQSISKEEAMQAAKDYGFDTQNPEAFDRVSKTRLFRKFPEYHEQIKKRWEGGEPSGPVIEVEPQGRGHVEAEIPDGERYVPKKKLTKSIQEDYAAAGKEIDTKKAEEISSAITDYITHTAKTIGKSDRGQLKEGKYMTPEMMARFKKESDLIDEYIKTAPPYTKSAPIYKGEPGKAPKYKDIKTGDIITMDRVTSWSSDEGVAQNFATGGEERFPGWETENSVMFKTKGVDNSTSIKQFAPKLYMEGSEVAMARGQKFKVASIDEKPVVRKIDGKESSLKVITLEPIEAEAAAPKAEPKSEPPTEKKIFVTDKSVRDHPQQAVIQGDTITVNMKIGRKKAGSYTIPVSEWEATARHPNPDWAKKKLVEKYGKVDELREMPGGPEQADRIIDSGIYAINKAFKQRTPTPKAEPPRRLELLKDEINSHITESKGLERGLDYYRDKEGGYAGFNVKSLKDLLKWTQEHENQYIKKRLGSNIEAELRSRESAIQKPAEAVKGTPTGIVNFPTDQLNVDPEKFQFKKEGVGAEGVTKKLKSIKKYDPELAGVISVWRNPKDGKVYVINGHHRYELAKRTGYPEMAVQFLRADDETGAMVRGGIINIAENNGSPIDAARIFRAEKLTANEISKKYGLSLKGEVAKKGYALSRLQDGIFNDVVTKQFPENWAVALGEGLPDNQDAQLAVVGVIEKAKRSGKNINIGIVEQMMKDAKAGKKKTETQTSLFGQEITERPLLIERAELRDYASKTLASDKHLFGIVSKKKRAERLAELAENVIDVETSKAVADEADTIKRVFDTLAGSKGPIGDALNEYAGRLADATGQERNTVKQDFVERLRGIVPKVIKGGKRGGPAGGGATPAPTSRLAAKEPILESKVRAKGDEFGGLFKPSKIKPKKEVIDPNGMYVDWAQTKITEKAGMKGTYYGVFNPDGSFKKWMNRTEIDRIKKAEGKPILTLGQDVYGKQKPKGAKSKQIGLGLVVEDKSQPGLFQPKKAKDLKGPDYEEVLASKIRPREEDRPPWGSRGLSRPPINPPDEDIRYIIDLNKKGKARSSEPGQNVILTGGPSGAGKSSGLKAIGVGQHDFVVADPDIIKKQAGYYIGEDAIKFHNASSAINNRLIDESIREGYDLIYDSLLANYPKAKQIIKRVISKGGSATIMFTNIDAETSQARSIMRNMLYNPKTKEFMSARKVPILASVKGYNFSLPTFVQLFKEYQGNKNVDFYLYDNNIDMADPKHVFSQIDGKISIKNDNLFDKLMGVDYIKSADRKGGYRYERKESIKESHLRERIPDLTERAKKTARGIAEKGKYTYRPLDSEKVGRSAGASQVDEKVLASKIRPKESTTPTKPTNKAKLKRHDQLLKAVQERLELPIRVGKFRQKAGGIYKTKSQVVRLKQANDIPTAMHEVGHHIQEILGLAGEMPAEVQALAYEGAKDLNKEGFAEFVRMYATEPEKAKAAAPTFYKTFEDALANKTALQDIFVEVRTAWQDFQASPAAQKVGSFVVSGDKKGGRISLNKIYTKVKDNLWPLRQAVKMAENKGHKFRASEDPYILARLTRGWTRKAEQYLKYGTFQLSESGGMVKSGPSLTEILKPIEKAGLRDQLDIYLISKRALTDPKNRIIKGFDGILSRKDFEQVVQDLDSKFKGVADKLQKYNDELLKYLVSSGRISQDLYKSIKANNPFYTPLYRFFDDEPRVSGLGQKSGNVFSPIKKLKGSSRAIYSPTESLLYNTYATINAAERSRVGAAMVRLSKLKGMGGLIENIPFPLKPTTANKEDLIRLLNKYDLGEFDFSDLPDEMILTFRPAYRAGPNEVIFYDEGKPKLYEIGDPELYEAMANISPSDINAAIKFASYPAKWLRAGATTFSPEFGIRNPLRDQMTAWIQSEYGYKPGFDFLRGIFHMMGKTETWQKFNAGGAAHSNIVSIDRTYLKKNLHDLFKSPWKGVALNPLELVQTISEYTEEATRVGEIARALKKEGGDLDALLKSALAAREVSLDFSRSGGATARSLNMLSAFWNARLEGLDKMARVHKKHPVRAALIAFMGVTLPSVMLWYAQKDDIYYNELPAWRRVLFWNIIMHKPDGTLNHVVSIPKPFEWGLIYGTLPEMALDWYYTKEKDAFIEALDQIKQTLNLFPMPTGATPIIEWFANKSIFFERPIVPRGKEDLPPIQQVRPGQSETVKLIAGIMDKVPGLKEVASPAKLENLLLGYTAGLGKVGLQAGDWLIENLGIVDVPTDPEMKWSQLPGVRAVFHRFPSANTRSIEQFYTKYLKTKQAWESKKEDAGLRGSLITELPGGRKFMPKTPADLQYYEKAAKTLSLLRKVANSVYKSKALSPEQKRERLDNIYMNMINTARTALQKGKIK